MSLREKQKRINRQLATDNIDYLTEFIIANLIKEGYDYDNIDVRAISYFKRGFKKDIDSLYYDDNKKILNFHVTRNALYDTLPESLFHEENAYEDLQKNTDNKHWLEKKRKKHEIEEKQARMFFFPFEKEFFRQRVDIELKEQFYYTSFEKNLPALKNIVDDIWGINENLTARQYFALFKWLPNIYKVVGNRTQTELCLTDILEAPIKIEVKSALESELPEDNTAFFVCGGDNLLGVNTVIGNKVNDGTFRWILHIGPLNKEQVKEFLPRGTKHNLLKIIERIIIPFEVDAETNLILKRKESQHDQEGICFELNDNVNSVLGFTTVL
ncbi:type VI secretion system baseplate subunit TssG [Emticicia sp. 17c]|uniref:type VI secretion system baseplate subunit TssG n=1 Tax=Emticicia sp. 17c TaxID=3127704 RepID=UPI00301C5C16